MRISSENRAAVATSRCPVVVEVGQGDVVITLVGPVQLVTEEASGTAILEPHQLFPARPDQQIDVAVAVDIARVGGIGPGHAAVDHEPGAEGAVTEVLVADEVVADVRRRDDVEVAIGVEVHSADVVGLKAGIETDLGPKHAPAEVVVPGHGRIGLGGDQQVVISVPIEVGGSDAIGPAGAQPRHVDRGSEGTAAVIAEPQDLVAAEEGRGHIQVAILVQIGQGDGARALRLGVDGHHLAKTEAGTLVMERVGPEHQLLSAVAYGVAIGVDEARIGAEDRLFVVGEAISVRVDGERGGGGSHRE